MHARALLLLDNETLAPPAGAPAASETVPSGRACPGTDAGVMDSPVNVAEVAAGIVGVDSADATTAVGAAGDESSPHAIDDAAEATATRVKNLPSHALVSTENVSHRGLFGGIARSTAILLPTG